MNMFARSASWARSSRPHLVSAGQHCAHGLSPLHGGSRRLSPSAPTNWRVMRMLLMSRRSTRAPVAPGYEALLIAAAAGACHGPAHGAAARRCGVLCWPSDRRAVRGSSNMRARRQGDSEASPALQSAKQRRPITPNRRAVASMSAGPAARPICAPGDRSRCPARRSATATFGGLRH
jgi:hypothetical protein